MAWPSVDGGLWEDGTAGGVASTSASAPGTKPPLRAQTLGPRSASESMRRAAELRKARVLAASTDRMRQVTGESTSEATAPDGLRHKKKKKKKRGKQRMPAFLRSAHNLEPVMIPPSEEKGNGEGHVKDGDQNGLQHGDEKTQPASEPTSLNSTESAAEQDSPKSLRASTTNPSSTTAARHRRKGGPVSFSNSLRKLNRKKTSASSSISDSSNPSLPQGGSWVKSERKAVKSPPFWTPARLDQIEFFVRTFTLLVCGALFGRDVIASFRELSSGDVASQSGEFQLLTMAMEEQPTRYLVVLVFMLCCTVTCSFATLRHVFFSAYVARGLTSSDFPETQMLEAAISVLQLVAKPGGAGASSGLSLVWQILGAVRAFFDDVCVFAIGLMVSLAMLKSGSGPF